MSTARGRSLRVVYTYKHRGYFPVYLIKPWAICRNNGQTTVYTTQQGVQGIYCAVSAVLALLLEGTANVL